MGATAFLPTLTTGLQAGALVPMEVIGEDMQVKLVKPMEIGKTTELTLEPGHYLVRAYLPSGETLSTQMEVGEDRRVTVMMESARPSPPITPTSPFAAFLGFVTRGVVHSLMKDIGFRTITDDAISPDLDQPPPFLLFLWEHDLSVTGRPGPFRQIPFPEASRPQGVGTPGKISPAREIEIPLALGQFCLQVEDPGRKLAKFVALPPADPVKVQIDGSQSQGTDADRLKVSVRGTNPRAESLLTYLSRGAFEAARTVGGAVLDDAEESLREKGKDPSGAAIGGYFLLRAAQPDRLHDWTGNLADRFPWLPDGCVIHAWHLLKQEESDPKRARKRLLEAEQRGLPLYTQGLRLLFDGLNLFARHDPDDREVGAALERVRPYAEAADWSARTTTFYGDTPGNPKPPPRTLR